MKELCMFEVGDLVSHGTGYRYVRHIKIKKGGTWIGFGRLDWFHKKNADLSQNQVVIKISFKCLTEDIKRVYSDINITLRRR